MRAESIRTAQATLRSWRNAWDLPRRNALVQRRWSSNSRDHYRVIFLVEFRDFSIVMAIFISRTLLDRIRTLLREGCLAWCPGALVPWLSPNQCRWQKAQMGMRHFDKHWRLLDGPQWLSSRAARRKLSSRTRKVGAQISASALDSRLMYWIPIPGSFFILPFFAVFSFLLPLLCNNYHAFEQGGKYRKVYTVYTFSLQRQIACFATGCGIVRKGRCTFEPQMHLS